MRTDNYTKVDSNITEYKAPTDESIRILNEFENKAKDNVLAKMRVNQNFVQSTGFFINDNFLNDTVEFHCKFILNNEEYKFKTDISRDELRNTLDKDDYSPFKENTARLIYDEFFHAVAGELMKQNINKLNKIIK